MLTGQAFFLFLYGLFWAQMLATTPRYNSFPTAKFVAGSENHGDRLIWARRLVVSIFILNLFPICWLVFLYHYVIVPAEESRLPIVAAALSSLSIFGFIRIYHGIVASKSTLKYFFVEGEAEKLKVHGPSGLPLTIWAHIVPGAAYLLIWPSLAKLVGDIPA
jgi:hypothetical protein